MISEWTVRNACSAPVFCGVTWLLSAAACAAQGDALFLGPTPYLSAADSPFAEQLAGPGFYLEDFEDGELNTPGVFQPIISPVLGESTFGTVLPPGEETDSVDIDDGQVDGLGRGGHSMRSNALLVSPMIPELNQAWIEFAFQATATTPLPNAFGLAWTDGPRGVDFRGGLSLVLSATDTAGQTHAHAVVVDEDALRTGETAEDFFLGVISPLPLERVRVRANFYGERIASPYIEIDHVQYGVVVPEPHGGVLAGFIVVAVAHRRPRRGRVAGAS